MEWIFNRAGLPEKMKQNYGNMTGYGMLVKGMADFETDVILINMPTIRTFTDLYDVIEHETLHIVCKFKGYHAEEDAINRVTK